jgi:hypothetical protein
MILGSAPLTLAHVAISLIGIATGFVVIWGFLKSRALDRWTAIFLVSTVATSVTGFIFFPFKGVTPGIVIGVISLVVLAVAIAARYRFALAGKWRAIYVVTAVLAQYLNFFVLIVQSFQKVSALHTLAPTQTELPFLVVQLAALAAFLALTVTSVMRFRGPTDAAK